MGKLHSVPLRSGLILAVLGSWNRAWSEGGVDEGGEEWQDVARDGREE